MSTSLQRQLRKAAADNLVYEREFDGLFIYTYTQNTVRSRLWDNLTRMARGLILDFAGNIVARPFDKFFNLFECDETEPDNLPKNSSYVIVEKVDGSMGTIFWNPIRNCWDIATKGSLHSDQADYAREELLPNYIDAIKDCIDPNLTLITEIIYPENRVVVNYGDYRGLRLLGIRNKHTGKEENTKRIPIVATILEMNYANIIYDNETWSAGIDSLPMYENMEGYVVKFENGLRVKIKNPWYLTIHKLIDAKSIKRIIDLVEGREWRAFWDVLPKELQKEFDDLYAVIRTAIWDIERQAKDAWLKMQEAGVITQTRKDFALWCLSNIEPDFRPIMFSMLDDKDWRHHMFGILKKRFK